ncbi:MAG: NAD(P)/FAD-dependent oxidoreductase [Longimicrobiales bacterium]|nr:NAD(P)/FAD-dependent oxidoreductase [Longimicrobiales bacterium]
MRGAPLPSSAEVVVVGAGLSGLSCALFLEQAGLDVHVVEASDAVGGRIRTDEVDGFTLDRGFQVLLTAYEEVQAQIDMPQLDLRAFKAGSLIWNGRSLEKMGDPYRDPASAMASLRAKVGSLADKMRVAKLRRRLTNAPAGDCFSEPDRSTQDELESLGFSAEFIDTFFRPFLGGVFLERPLETSASLFRYYFRCFAIGEATVPAQGMQRLPEQMASTLDERISLGTTVQAASATQVSTEGGQTVSAQHVVVALDGASASTLLGTPVPAFKATVTSYFAAEEAPTAEPVLVLDGEGTGPANHIAVMSNVAPKYAPAGAHLVAVSGVDGAADDPMSFHTAASDQLARWFGPKVSSWQHLKTYRVPHALPRHPAGSLQQQDSARRRDGIIVAGDYTEFGSIQGALRSGRRAAEAILEGR